MVRFAYETGLKCLYTNFPDDLSLVINHREDGVSYSDRKGSASTLLREKDYSERLFHLPSIRFLANWQLDFNVRRAGAYAGQQSIDVKDLENTIEASYVEFTSFFELYDSKMSSIIHNQKSSSLPLLHSNRMIFRPALYHSIWNVLDAYISYNVSILHFGVTLLFPYIQIHNHYPSVNNYFLSEFHDTISWDSHISSLLSIRKLNSEITCIKNDLSRHFDFIVLELSETNKERSSHFSKLLSEISSSYLIVIGNCYGAPTDINTRRERERGEEGLCEPKNLHINSTSTSCVYDFSLVEELCDNDNYLKGILIYRFFRLN